MKIRLLIIAIIVIANGGSAQADLVTYSFSGTISNTSDVPTPDLIGAAVLLSFSINSPGVDSKPNDSKKGVYEGQTSGTFSIQSATDSYTGTLETNGAKKKLEITNKPGGDELNLDHSFTGDAMNFGGTDFAASKIQIHLKDGTALEFSSIALPTSFSSPIWWNQVKNAKIEFSNGNGKKKKRTLVIDIDSSTASPVPEPGSLALVALMAAGSWGVRRRKKHDAA